MKQPKTIYSLIALESFKSVLGIDDREDPLSRFCLTIATHTIEQYCMRRILRKRHFERIEASRDLILTLREYPVSEILAVYAMSRKGGVDGDLIEPDFYGLISAIGADVPSSLSLSPAVMRMQRVEAFKVVYWAGYTSGKVPPDLASACLELASWNMARYRGRRFGLTGAVREQAKDGEHFEPSMPENVRSLLEPYRRRVI